MKRTMDEQVELSTVPISPAKRPSWPPIPADTTPEAFEVQMAIYRKMTPDQAIQNVLALNRRARACATAGVRMRHPDYTDDQVRLAVIRMALGDKLFREVYPGCEVET